MVDADLLGALHREGLERVVPHEPRQGSNGSVDRLRPPHTNRLRPRPCSRPRRGRQGRRSGRTSRTHAHTSRRHPAGTDEHLDDDQRDSCMAARAVRRERRGAGHTQHRTAWHHAERHREGIPVARHIHLPARPVEAPDRRHGRLVYEQCTEVEPDERVLVPPAGSGCHPRAGNRLFAGHRHRHSRCGPRQRPGRGITVRPGVRFDFVLRECGHPLRRRDVQDARVHRTVGSHRSRALRRHRREGSSFPLRRAGELARPHRGTTREQRATHRSRDACRHAVEARTSTFGAVACVERGTRSSPSVGPAVVAAHATGSGVRNRSS